MATTGATIPTFSTNRGHPAVRVAIILALCASLAAGFIASSTHSMPSSAAHAADAVACDTGAGQRTSC